MRDWLKYLIKLGLCPLLYYSGLWHVLMKLIRPRGLFVFNYHNFSSFVNSYRGKGSIFEVGHQRSFARQLAFYARHFARKSSPIIESCDFEIATFLITFDDGYKDNHEIAVPLLEKHRIPAIFFITSGAIGNGEILWHDRLRWLATREPARAASVKRILAEINAGSKCFQEIEHLLPCDLPKKRLMMNREEAARIGRSPLFAVCGHTQSHLPLANMKESEQRREILESIRFASRFSPYAGVYFSYPNGRYDSTTISILRDAGVDYAFTTENGYNRSAERPLSLKRIGIKPRDTIPVVALKIMRSLFA